MMKQRILSVFLSLVLSAALAAVGCGARAELPSDDGSSPSAPSGAPGSADARVAVTLEDTSDVLLNPGKGYMHYGDPDYQRLKTRMYLVGTGYHRFNWCDLMDESGQYDFGKIRDRMATYAKFGRPFGFGVMAVNTSSTKEYITPKYVIDRCAKHFVHRDGENKQYIPDWKDPAFLEEAARLAAELGQEFNGDENVSFVEILSYGNWGEQHLFHIEVEGYPDYREKESISPEFFKEYYVRPYIDAFPDTLLYCPWGGEDLDEAYRELIDEGVALRRDGIIKYTNGLETLGVCAQKLPTGFEFSKSYRDFIDGGMTDGEFNERLEEAMAIAKPSYINFDDEWYDNDKEYVEELANRMGYYFRLKGGKYAANLKRGEETTVTLSFRNDGMAPVYEPCKVYLGLLDADGNLVKKFETPLDAKTWLPGATEDEDVTLKLDAAAGTYWLAAGLFRKDTDDAPTYLLGSKSKADVGGKWYALGQISLS